MNSTELRERLNKAQEKAMKIEGIIAKHYARYEKKLEQLNKLGFIDYEDAWNWIREEDDKLVRNEYGFATRPENVVKVIEATGYIDALEDAHDAEKKLQEQMKVVENWKERLDRQVEIERTFITDIPEAFKEAREDLKARWIKSDIAEREAMYKSYKELDYKEFRKIYTYSAEQSLRKTDEEFEKIEERESMLWVLDLYNRVYNITGKATDCSRLVFNGKALNGTVIGENGTATVETIEAGGYNIQRFHYRVLVK